jgi:hypothetical protein
VKKRGWWHMRRVTLLAIVMMVVFVSTASADPAQPFRFTQPVFTVNTCTGEALQGTAIEQGVVHIQEVGGVTHLFMTTGLIRLSLVSEDGTEYGGVNRQVEQFHGTLEGEQSITFVGHSVITPKGPGPTEIIHVTRRVTVDEDGVVTVVADTLVFECVGG